MARITKEARKHAERHARRRGAPLDGLLDDDDELGSTLGNLAGAAGGIIGSVYGGPVGGAAGSALGKGLGNAIGGGGGSRSAKTNPNKVTSTTPMVAAAPAPESRSPSHEEVRNIVKDALDAHRAKVVEEEVHKVVAEQQARDTADQVTAALAPTAQAARGGIQEQRLQTQATQEHRAIQRREAAERLSTERYTSTSAQLAHILDLLGKVQQKLAGRTAVVRGKAIDVLGGDALARTR